MTAEAEKVINMSLTKMAESRGVRRGGTSLHKHLLISSVLTKARSAYIDTWHSVSVSSNNLPTASSIDDTSTPTEPSSSSLKNKRRREWNFDSEDYDDEVDTDENSSSGQLLGHTKRFRFEISENYTFRSACEIKENTIPAGTSILMSISTNYNSTGNRTPLEPFFTFKGSNFNFRTKKSQFDEVDEEVEDSPFLFEDEDDSLDYGPIENGNNDRRVPSSNGSFSSSDEEYEQDSAMEVDLDKITNLVQYFSFSKATSNNGNTGLVRSISTPDLCSRTTGGSDNITNGESTNTKDLLSAFTSSHHHHHHQRVLTMKV